VSKSWWYPTAFSLWGDEEYEAIGRVVQTDRFTMGEEVAAFEREFADYHGMKHGIMVNSGSSANLIMVAALFALGRLQRGDKVLVPALAWSTTYAPLIQHGLDLELVDCDGTWCAFDPEPLDHEDIKLIVSVPILGAPQVYANTQRMVADTWCIPMVEDNCEALGASVHGHPCGTRGLMNSFSFFYSHQLSAIEGGMVLTDDDDCARMCRILRAHGWTRDVEAPKSFDEEYNFTHFGYNVRPVEMHAAIARCQLRKLKDFVDARRANLKFFHSRRDYYGLPIKLQQVKGLYTSPFALPFMVETSELRNKVVVALRAADIDCRLPTGGCFQMHPYGAPWRDQATPNARRVHETGLFLGNAPFAIEDKIDRACQIIQAALTGTRRESVS